MLGIRRFVALAMLCMAGIVSIEARVIDYRDGHDLQPLTDAQSEIPMVHFVKRGKTEEEKRREEERKRKDEEKRQKELAEQLVRDRKEEEARRRRERAEKKAWERMAGKFGGPKMWP
jgi:hypothetical protein